MSRELTRAAAALALIEKMERRLDRPMNRQQLSTFERDLRHLNEIAISEALESDDATSTLLKASLALLDKMQAELRQSSENELDVIENKLDVIENHLRNMREEFSAVTEVPEWYQQGLDEGREGSQWPMFTQEDMDVEIVPVVAPPSPTAEILETPRPSSTHNDAPPNIKAAYRRHKARGSSEIAKSRECIMPECREKRMSRENRVCRHHANRSALPPIMMTNDER